MRKGWRWGLVAMVWLMLVACAAQRAVVSPTDAVARVRTGAPLLSCREACVADWRQAQPQAAQLDATGSWPELAALVLSVGYQDDLTLYYLARAAEGLRYPGAAASYYRQSTYISGTSLSCQHQSGVCGGVVLPQAALLRVAAIEHYLKARRLRRPASTSPNIADPQPAPNGPEASPPTEEEPAVSPGTGDAAPQPEPALSGRTRTGRAASEYIEPPAAR